jgi:hypothetical protein
MAPAAGYEALEALSWHGGHVLEDGDTLLSAIDC